MKLQPRDRRVQKLLARQLKSPGYRWDEISDPRARRGRRWALRELLRAALLGQLSGCPGLRDVEALTEDLGPSGRQWVSRRVPDTTLWDLLSRLSAEQLRGKLIEQLRAAWRSKALKPSGLPCGSVAIDGKGLGALEHDAGGMAQKAHRSHDGRPYWLSRVLRAVLTSAEARPCLDQMPIAAKSNEMGEFGQFFDGLMTAYGAGDLFEIATIDAGMTSLENATKIHQAQKAYVMALKGPQAALLTEAKRLLGRRRTPDAETDWEVYKGRRIKRRFFRTDEIAGYHGWTHLRQAWRLEQETVSADGKQSEREQRYFLTNLPRGRLSPAQCMELIRRHWGVENDCFWTLDTQWSEDHVPWCSSGRAVEVLSWFRLMAYNLLQQTRRRHLRLRNLDGTYQAPQPWRRIFTWVRMAWQLELAPVTQQAAALG
ncbi:MAG: ISAs1 family transposase [Acidobacteriia bacterium]|nr:ISAs1 family transposase [Terriglobia bacterium]